MPANPIGSSVSPNGWGQDFAVIGALIGAAKLYENFTLPSCDAKRSLDTLQTIFKDKNLPSPTLTDAKEVAHTADDKNCEAAYAIPNEKGVLEYRVYWKEKDVQVLITKVRS